MATVNHGIPSPRGVRESQRGPLISKSREERSPNSSGKGFAGVTEACTAQNWSALGGLEGDCGLCAALGAVDVRVSAVMYGARAFCFAFSAMLWVVCESPLMEELLFSRRKDKFRAARRAQKVSVCKMHRLSRSGGIQGKPARGPSGCFR